MSGALRLKSPSAIFGPLANMAGIIDYRQLVELKTYDNDGYSHVRLPNGRELMCSDPDQSNYRDIRTGKQVSLGVDIAITLEIRRREAIRHVDLCFQDIRNNAQAYNEKIFKSGTIVITKHTRNHDTKAFTNTFLEVAGGGCVINCFGYRDIKTGESVSGRVGAMCREQVRLFDLQEAQEVKKLALAAPQMPEFVTATPIVAQPVENVQRFRPIIILHVKSGRSRLVAQALRKHSL